MKFYHLLFVSFLWILLACSAKSKQTTSRSDSIELPSISYDSFLQTVKESKATIAKNDYPSAEKLLYTVITDHIPRYWIGTKWDFNGTTTKPKHGTIACGYFLTTVMDQTGFDIKRIWMAQQASSVLIQSYCSDIKIKGSLEGLKSYLKNQPDSSCFILGLDFHTGFVTKNGNTYTFIHSNYIRNEGVIKESVDESEALSSNKYFMIGSLSKNKVRLSEWMGW